MPFTFVPSTEHLDFPMEMWTDGQLVEAFHTANLLLDWEKEAKKNRKSSIVPNQIIYMQPSEPTNRLVPAPRISWYRRNPHTRSSGPK